jgi:hypothetical protein
MSPSEKEVADPIAELGDKSFSGDRDKSFWGWVIFSLNMIFPIRPGAE